MSTHATRVLFDEPGPRGRRVILVWSVVVVLLAAGLVAGALWQFYNNDQLDPVKWQMFGQGSTLRFLGAGLKGTFLTTVVAAVVAFPLALLLALGRLSRLAVVSRPVTAWIEFFRSVPMLLVVYFFLLALPRVHVGGQPLNLPIFWMLVVPMILVSSASNAEVFRAGILAVDKGQSEAAASLGMTHGLTMRLVVLPQAFRLVLPNLLTGLVSLLKDSTLGYVVSYPELMQQGRVLTAVTHYLIQTYLVVALVYVVINFLLTQLAHRLQARITRRATPSAAVAPELESDVPLGRTDVQLGTRRGDRQASHPR